MLLYLTLWIVLLADRGGSFPQESPKWEKFFKDAVRHFEALYPIIVITQDSLPSVDLVTTSTCSIALYEVDTQAVSRHIQVLYENKELDLIFLVGQDTEALVPLLQDLEQEISLLFSKVVTVVPHFGNRDIGIQLRFDSKMYLYEYVANGFTLYERYAIKGGLSIQPTLGNWTQEAGIKMQHPFMWERRTNMFGIQGRDSPTLRHKQLVRHL
jgi:hypothetical protein